MLHIDFNKMHALLASKLRLGSNILQGLRKNASYLPAQVLSSMGECAGKAGQLDEGRQTAGNPMAGTNHTKSLVNWKAVTNSRLVV